MVYVVAEIVAMGKLGLDSRRERIQILVDQTLDAALPTPVH